MNRERKEEKEMKRTMWKSKFLSALCAVLMAGALGGCGGDHTESSVAEADSGENTQEETQEGAQEDASGSGTDRVHLCDVDASAYVTLGQYKGLIVSVASVEVDEDELEELVVEVFQSQLTADMGEMGRPAEEGDTVVIDYVGYQDGEAFSGGTASGQFLTLGSDTYIDGFEDGLVGVTPGETVDLELTFPDNYGTSLAGADVVFTVTMQYIAPEMTDEVVAAFDLEEFGTVEEMRQYCYDALAEDAQAEYESDVEAEVITAMLNECSFSEDLPEDLYNQYVTDITEMIETMASWYGLDGDTYTYYVYGVTMSVFAESYAVYSTQEALALQLIAEKEGLTISDEELTERIAEYADEVGYTVEELAQTYDDEEFREYFMYEDVIDFLVEEATVVGL